MKEVYNQIVKSTYFKHIRHIMLPLNGYWQECQKNKNTFKTHNLFFLLIVKSRTYEHFM